MVIKKPKKTPLRLGKMKLSPAAASRIRMKASKAMTVKPDPDSAAGAAT